MKHSTDMTQGKRIILSTFGSFGDIHPYMAIALELQERGYQPLIATMEYYREKIEQAGLQFRAVRPNVPVPQEQEQEFIEKIMEPKSGPRFLMEEVIFPAVRESYTDLTEVVAGADLLVTHPAAPAGPLVGRKTGIPWISTVLAPMSFFSAYDPPVPPFWPWTIKIKVLGPRVMRTFLDVMANSYRAKPVVRLRDELGIPDYGNPITVGQHSPTLVLALFSSLFGPPQPDRPKQAHATGFCFYDGHHQDPLPPELSDFLSRGDAPIVFTLGTSAVWVARDFFEHSIEAARLLSRRAVLLIGDDRNKPAVLPDNVIAVDYAPYQSLLPHAAAVVHHGGVGTTSQGLLSGAPTLVVPFAFDQLDNASHVERLGTSRTLYRKNYTASRVAKELSELLDRPEYSQNAIHVSEKLKQEHGAKRAADLIEQVFGRAKNSNEELAYASRN